MPKRRAEGNTPEPSWDEQPVPAEPQPQPNALQPQPLPENWNLAPLPGGGVLVQIRHLAGVHFSFMPRELALQVADGLRTIAGGSGIIAAPASALHQLPPFTG
jgi:glucose/arabinose dehydrogenase